MAREQHPGGSWTWAIAYWPRMAGFPATRAASRPTLATHSRPYPVGRAVGVIRRSCTARPMAAYGPRPASSIRTQSATAPTMRQSRPHWSTGTRHETAPTLQRVRHLRAHDGRVRLPVPTAPCGRMHAQPLAARCVRVCHAAPSCIAGIRYRYRSAYGGLTAAPIRAYLPCYPLAATCGGQDYPGKDRVMRHHSDPFETLPNGAYRWQRPGYPCTVSNGRDDCTRPSGHDGRHSWAHAAPVRVTLTADGTLRVRDIVS